MDRFIQKLSEELSTYLANIRQRITGGVLSAEEIKSTIERKHKGYPLLYKANDTSIPNFKLVIETILKNNKDFVLLNQYLNKHGLTMRVYIGNKSFEVFIDKHY
ncbi:MAG: hypothetical protein N2485_08380 [bacterium]|nr:hypothetical protein [bacterium]